MKKIKLKTLSSAKKRFKILKSGLIKYKKSNMRHILTKKSNNRKRNLRKKSFMCKRNSYLINRCLPYK